VALSGHAIEGKNVLNLTHLSRYKKISLLREVNLAFLFYQSVYMLFLNCLRSGEESGDWQPLMGAYVPNRGEPKPQYFNSTLQDPAMSGFQRKLRSVASKMSLGSRRQEAGEGEVPQKRRPSLADRISGFVNAEAHEARLLTWKDTIAEEMRLLQEEVEKLREENRLLRQEIRELQQENRELRQENKLLKQEIKRLNIVIEDLHDQLSRRP
jgi:FtsZ-binding cell division protein ZapB